MQWMRRIAIAILGRYGARLRFPHLLLLAAALFGFDLVMPDAIPFLDEILLGLATLVFASWKKDRGIEAGDEGGEQPGASQAGPSRLSDEQP